MSQNILIKEERTTKEREYSNWVASMTSDFYDKHSHNNLSYVKRRGHVKMNSLSTGGQIRETSKRYKMIR